MSRWTHVDGGITFDATVFEIKGGKYRIPLPKEQIKIHCPHVGYLDPNERKEGKNAPLSFSAIVYSLPRVEKTMKEAFGMLPQGETGHRYAIKQDESNVRSSTLIGKDENGGYPWLPRAIKAAICRFMEEYDPARTRPVTYASLKRWRNVEIGWVEEAEEFTVGIGEDLRHCSGEEYMFKLEKFFRFLESKGIMSWKGYVEWHDEYKPDYIYAWRAGDKVDVAHRFMILSSEDNRILWCKELRYKRKSDGTLDFKAYNAKDYETVAWGSPELAPSYKPGDEDAY